MANAHGRFIWHELLTTNAASAAKFYADVIGWTAGTKEAGGVRYTIMSAGAQPVAALAEAAPGAPGDGEIKGWVAYTHVEDVDATADKLVQLGGALREPPSETAGLGRFAVLDDPQGALIGLFAPAAGNSDPERGDPMAPGQATWHELYVDDAATAFSVYADAFGWEKITAFEMGPAGPYQVFGVGGDQMGGMMRRPPQAAKAYWNTFFRVEDITSAEQRIKVGGGVVFDGPREIPGGFTLRCFDPQGAMFALAATQR